MAWFNMNYNDIGIDLGTATVLVYVRDKGIVIREPTLAVVDSARRDRVLYIGEEAGYHLGRTRDSAEVVRPLVNGTIVDFDTAKVMIRYFIRKAIGTNYLVKPKVLVSVPSDLPALSRRAVVEAVQVAGIKKMQKLHSIFLRNSDFSMQG